jgi:twitching motility protein PilT
LQVTVERGASDLHITTNSEPQIRIDGVLRPLEEDSLTPTDTKRLVYSILTDKQKQRLEENLEIDLSFGIKGLARFRANVYHQRGALAAAFRQIPFEIRSFRQLGLPTTAEKICEKPRGLVLVTGPTGSGKTTSLAAMIDKINAERHEHIVTIEDPIEYLHAHKSCLINQRELHADTHSFANSLKSVLRQDPDVCLIGEMRDLETVELALRIAETGHLTFATLHTNSAAQTINRIIDIFARGSGAHQCHPEPDSGRQGPSDLRHDADRPGQARHADLQSEPGLPLLQTLDHDANGDGAFFLPRRAAGDHRSRAGIAQPVHGGR